MKILYLFLSGQHININHEFLSIAGWKNLMIANEALTINMEVNTYSSVVT